MLVAATMAQAQKALWGDYERAFRDFIIEPLDTAPQNFWQTNFRHSNDQGTWMLNRHDQASFTTHDGRLTVESLQEGQTCMYRFFQDLRLHADSLMLTGEAKVSDESQFAVLLLQDSISSHCELQGDKRGWQPFKVSIPLADSEREGRQVPFLYLYFTAKRANATIQLRHLRMFVDGKPLSEACPPPPANHDHEFDGNSRFTLPNTLTDAQVERLATICRVWGYQKYHHPDLRRGQKDWNFELFRILRDAFLTEGEEQFMQTLNAHIPPITRLPSDYEHHYALTSCRGNAEEARTRCFLALNETAYDHIPVGDDGYRLLGLFRYWNAMYYFHPYMAERRQQWLELLPAFIRRFAAARTDSDFDVACKVAAAALKDTHTALYGNKTNVEAKMMWHSFYLPMKVMLTRDGESLMITRFLTKGMQQSPLRLGDQITHVNGRSVKEIREERQIYSNFEGTSLDHYAPAYASFDGDSVCYDIVREGHPMTIRLTNAMQYWAEPLPEATPDTTRMLTDSIAYVNLCTISRQQLSLLLPTLAHTKGIVFDMRGYPNENIRDVLGDFLLPHPTVICQYDCADLQHPGAFFRNRYATKAGKGNPDYYRGIAVVLVNGLTASAAELTTETIRQAPRGYVIGQPTGGVLAPTVAFPFTSGRAMRYTSCLTFSASGHCFHPNGIPLSEEVWPTPEDIAAGCDTELLHAIQTIFKQ